MWPAEFFGRSAQFLDCVLATIHLMTDRSRGLYFLLWGTKVGLRQSGKAVAADETISGRLIIGGGMPQHLDPPRRHEGWTPRSSPCNLRSRQQPPEMPHSNGSINWKTVDIAPLNGSIYPDCRPRCETANTRPGLPLYSMAGAKVATRKQA